MEHFDRLRLKEHSKIKWGGETLVDLDCTNDISILNESATEMNEVLDN